MQLALPVRGLVRDKLETRGDFSWNMYSQRFQCDDRYVHLLPDGRALRLDVDEFVYRGRFSKVCHYDRLPRFHEWLCEEAERRHPGSSVRGGVTASHNLGPSVRLVAASTEICSTENYGVPR